MNVELLLKVKKHILEKPNRLVMGTFIVRQELGESGFQGDGAMAELIPFAECRTAACIAGWVCLLSGRPIPSFIERHAVEALDISFAQGNDLFYDGNWPYEFKRRYRTAVNQTERAKVAAERIDAFIREHQDLKNGD